MAHRHSPYRRWLVILLLTVLAPITPGKMNLCLLPDGERHLETECSTPCSAASPQAQTGADGSVGVYRLNDNSRGCLDLTVGESAAGQQIHNVSQASAPGLLILPQPLNFFPAGKLRTREYSPAPSPHLQFQQTTVLRI